MPRIEENTVALARARIRARTGGDAGRTAARRAVPGRIASDAPAILLTAVATAEDRSRLADTVTAVLMARQIARAIVPNARATVAERVDNETRRIALRLRAFSRPDCADVADFPGRFDALRAEAHAGIAARLRGEAVPADIGAALDAVLKGRG